MEVDTSEDINWEDFMNVVTTYSCKFCPFTCTVPADMGRHVKQVHMPKKIMQVQMRPGETEAVPVDVCVDPTAPARIDGEHSPAVSNEVSKEVLEVSEDLVLKETDDRISAAVAMAIEGHEEAGEGHFIIVEETPMSGYVHPQSGCGLVDSSQNIPTVLAISSRTDTQSTVAIPANSVQTIDLAQAVFDASSGQYSLVTEAPISNGEPTVTKELFLCGQCSSGFGSIDECREHMIADHSPLIGAREGGGGDSVSVGTQVAHKKRPGRKRKSEVAAQPLKLFHQDEEDEDWEPGYDISGGRESRKKRKIRPPKALKEDYYLGKRKKRKRERRTYSEAYTFKCKLFGCHARFTKATSLEMHSSCHNDTDYNFSCFQCKEQFAQWKTLRIHMWKKHEIDCDLFQCDICGTKADTFHKLLIHKEIHSENRPYTCDICGKGFKQFSQMRNHQVIHTEHRVKETEHWYSSKQCEVCQRVFANRKCLKKHMQAVHSKEKPFVCPYCGHAASRKAMLDLHIRVHTGEKPFKCDVCPYATGDHNSLRRHKMRHTGQKQYKCQYCPYSCIQAISLKTHMKNKHPGMEGIYACDTCIFRTVNKTSYEQHMLDHKNGLVPEVKVAKHVVQKKANDNEQPQLVLSPAEALGDQPQAVLIDQSQSSEATMIEMHVQTMPTGEAQIRAEDLTRLSNCEELVSGDISAASLIYQALSAISKHPEHTTGNATQSAHILGRVQTLIKSSSTELGVTTHTITFYVPSGSGGQEVGEQEVEGQGQEVGGQGQEVGGQEVEGQEVGGQEQEVGGQANQEAQEQQEEHHQVYFEEPVEVIEALQRAGSQQGELLDGTQGNLPTVITMEASEAELEGMSLSLVPVSSAEGTIILQQAHVEV